MKKIAYTLVILLMVACSKNEDVSISIDIELLVYDTNGLNRLEPSTPGAYATEDIRVYFKKDGKWVEEYNGRMRYPRSFALNTATANNPTYITLFPYIEKSEPRAATLIRWNDQDSDTIQCEYTYPNDGPSVYTSKIWLNGELVWTTEDRTPRLINIVH